MEYEKNALNDCYDNIRGLRDTRLRFLTFFGTATLTSLFFSIRENNAALMMLASAISLCYLIGDIYIRRHEKFHLVLAYMIEKKNEIVLGTARNYVAFRDGKSKRLSSFIDSNFNEKDVNDLKFIIKRLPMYWGVESFLGHFLVLIISLFWFALAVLLNFYADWKFFS